MPSKRSSFSPELRRVIDASADPARAASGFHRLSSTEAGAELAGLTEEHARIVAALLAGSEPMGQLLLKHPEHLWTVLTPENLAFPRRGQGLRQDVNRRLPEALRMTDPARALRELREFKQQEMLRIAARDLARLGDAPELTLEISNLADVCLDTVLTICRQQRVERFGRPYHRDAAGGWQPTEFAVLGLGKLGGQELNYSSDVDVLLVYSEEGQVFKEPPRRRAESAHAMTSHQFFRRVAEAFVAEVTRLTAEGILFRIDLRLRPEGEAGPLVRSLASYDNYYALGGQTWERMMLVKARGVGGDVSLAAEFLEMIQPFRYPRSVNGGALREIAAMKLRIESEVVRSGELERNVKLGRGGIREIEFIVQTAQILNAGRIPFLQGAQTLPLLQKLAQYHFLSVAEARDLAEAYCFLRDVEHRLQMDQNLQTHSIPAEARARERLARLMGFTDRAAFDTAFRRHTQRVRELYEKLVQVDAPKESSPFPKQFRGAEAEWKRLLGEHRFCDLDRSLRLLDEFVNGPGYGHVSPRTTGLAMGLLPRLLALCGPPKTGPGKPSPGRAVLSDPDRVLARLDGFIAAYGARAVMLETWASHPQIFELLLLLFDRSEFLAEIAIRTPDLVDDLVLSGRLARSKTAAEILADLRYGQGDPDQRLWLRRYHQAEFMRIGLRSILGLADPELNFIELTALADACLQYALEVACRAAKLRSCPLVILGLGKLGGRELTYGSDLDLLFVADVRAEQQLPKLQKLAVQVMGLLSSPTELGVAFVTDARLRPDGEKGLLVNTLPAYEEYYRTRAQLWEIQVLTRTRPIAGDLALGQRFQELAASLTNFGKFAASAPGAEAVPGRRRRIQRRASGQGAPPACFVPGWKQEIARMRRRIEKERTPPGQDALAFKTGSGGLIDVEFIAQAYCLERGWQEPNTLKVLERIHEEQLLPAEEAVKLIENYRRLRRLECILRRWSFEGEALLPMDPASYYRVSVRCGFETPEAFQAALAEWRQAVRDTYRKVFAVGAKESS